MIEVHMVPTPNGYKVTIMLEEIGMPYRMIPYNIIAGDQFKPEFLAINPNNKLPAIVDLDPPDGGAPYPVFESGAILAYLADISGQLWPRELRARHDAMQWLMFQMAGLGPMHGQAHHFVRYAPENIPYALERYLNEARRLMRVLDGRLGKVEYLAGEYSIADIACWPWIRAARVIEIPLEDYPNLKRWFEAVDARPGVQRGTAASDQALVDRTPGKKVPLNKEQWSTLFGERQHEAR